MKIMSLVFCGILLISVVGFSEEIIGQKTFGPLTLISSGSGYSIWIDYGWGDIIVEWEGLTNGFTVYGRVERGIEVFTPINDGMTMMVNSVADVAEIFRGLGITLPAAAINDVYNAIRDF